MKNKIFSILFAVVLVLSFSLVAAVPAMAQATIYVDASNIGDPLEDGSAAHPFDKIQEGIDAAVSGDTVQVAAGTYYENITLKDGVEALGAGASVTTIDGGGNGSVVTAISVGSTTKLDGFTITNGNAFHGGGMSNWSSSSPMVRNCTFLSNTATYGGGIYSYYSSPMVSNCIFSGNSASGEGGGMYNNKSSPTVTNCTFFSNSASRDGGGGICNFSDSSPTVTNCIFSANSTSGKGGGMFNVTSSSPTVTNCTFSSNSATNGGGMYNWSYSSSTVTNCILWGNGEEIYNSGSTPVVTYCDVQGGYTGTGNINVDPLFVNPAADDYHLQIGSPCIDAGYNSAPSLPSTDFEGDPRIVDGDGDTVATVDMGADEYVPPQQAAQYMISDVEALDLPDGIENSLVSKLEAAIESLNRGQGNAARNQLNAFINQVEAQRGKKISIEQADELIETAQRIIGNI